MKIHTLLLAATLATGGAAFAQTTPATPAVTPAPAPAAQHKAPAQHKAAMHKMRMHGHTHKAAASAAPTGADQTTTRDERMAAAEADYKASLETKGNQSTMPAHKMMQHHHAGHAMHKHQPAKAAPAA